MQESTIKQYLPALHEGLRVFKADDLWFYSLEGKGLVLSMDGMDIQVYILPEYRGQGMSTKYIRQIVREELNRHTTLEVSFLDDWYKKAFFNALPHSDILTFDTPNGLYMVNARKKGKFIEFPYDYKI